MGFLKTAWTIFTATALMALAARLGAAPAEADDPQLAEFATRVGELIRQVAGAAPAAPAPQAGRAPRTAVAAPNATVQELVKEVGGDVQVQLRPGNQTVMQLRGSALETSAKGAAPMGLANAHEQSARKFFVRHRDLMRLADPARELALVRNERDELGYEHLRFRQQYKGLAVWPAEVRVQFDPAGNLNLVEGAYVPTPELASLEPGLTAAEAIQRATAQIAPGKNPSTTEPELIIYGPVNRTPRLAWKFNLSVSLLKAWLVVVDAQEGTILHRSSRVSDAQVKGSALDLSGTNRVLNVWQKGDTYYLIDTSKKSFDPAFDPLDQPRGVIRIGDAQDARYNDVVQGQVDVSVVTSRSPDAWSPRDAVSAAYNFSEVYDYYLERLGRNSIDGQGGSIAAVVRIGGYDNACWLNDLHLMLFGDVRPYVASLDVVGHELTHGVVQHTAGLPYENQPGALNEAFADIFGEMIEARTRGQNDWLIGGDLDEAYRNLQDPGAIFSTLTVHPYPAKMSEFADLPNTDDGDSGGVHINSTIIGHAFYLLAEGLPGAVGLRPAESVFYRCLTQHLLAQSQFIDCRLGCVASAEELFGKDSTEARMTAQAFDSVEIYATPGTPEPTPVPAVSGPDSTLFVYYDPDFQQYNLGRMEAAKGDEPSGIILATSVVVGRPAVTGDGSIAMFVSPDFDMCALNTADPNSRRCLGFAGRVHSVAISPDAKLAAFVLRDPQTGEADGKITLLDLAANKTTLVNLVAPVADGVSVDRVLYADSMSFSTDSADLFYDAVSQLRFGSGPAVQRWSIYSLHLATGKTSILVAPQDGVDTGNPAIGRAGNRYLAYDSQQAATKVTSVMIMDLFTGEKAKVGTLTNGLGFPSFLGDESAVIYAAPDADATASGFSLFKQDLSQDHLHTVGHKTLWYQDADLGITYRRGSFLPTNALPTVTLQLSADQVAAPANVTLTATATDSDGTILRVEFYDGSTKLAQVESVPYTFVWQNVPPGNHLLTARAVDDLGGSKDSSPRFLTVTGGSANRPPTVTLQLSADRISTQDSVTLTATATDPDGTIALVEFYDTSDKLGQADTAPYTFTWKNPPPGNHLVKARAVDNAGAQADSSLRFLTVSGSGTPPTNGDEPKLSIQAAGKNTVRLTVRGKAGDYIITMSDDLKTWVDIYPVTIQGSGVGVVDDSGGPIHSPRLFYRVRRDQ